MERMSTQVQARRPEMDELTCVLEAQPSQHAAGVVGVEDPLQMSDTEQGDIVLETQQELDSSAEDIADTHAGRRARAKRLTKGARKRLLYSVMRMSRN